MVFLKEQLEPFIGQLVLRATGDAQRMPFDLFAGQPLKAIKTFGKELLFIFPDFALRIHLMLFGKYAIKDQLNRTLRLGLTFESEEEINFYACDCRLISEPLENLYDWRTDVLHPAFDPAMALAKLQGQPHRLICEALLNQDIFAGVGNGIKNEVLFRNQIHPESQVGEIPAAVLQKLIQTCVTQSRAYLHWKQAGMEGEHWQAYKQKTCPRDDTPLRKEKIGKSRRTSYFCDKCQHLYLPDAF